MSTLTVIGLLATRRGHYQQQHPHLGALPGNCSSYDYVDAHRRPLPILRQHCDDLACGTTEYLERSRSAGGLVAVGIVDADRLGYDEAESWWFSPGIATTALDAVSETNAQMFELSLSPHQGATIGAGRCWFAPIDLRHTGGGRPRGLPLALGDVWDRAHEAMQPWSSYQRADHLAVVDIDAARVLANTAARRRTAPPPPARKALVTYMGRPIYDRDVAERILADLELT